MTDSTSWATPSSSTVALPFDDPVINVIEKNPKMQILVPFILQEISSKYKNIINNGALKKNLYVMVINSLLKNPRVNLEYHKHIIIKVLDYFLTSSQISVNMNKDELVLRENAAKVLSKLVLSNNDLKYVNLKPHLFDMLCKKLVTLMDSFEVENYPIISAIFLVGRV